MKVIVTGAAGFIGSNIVRGLNNIGIDDIIAVDDLSDGSKFQNLADLTLSDYIDMDDFYDLIERRGLDGVEAVFHEGACSDTMNHDGRFMLKNNYTRSVQLLDFCKRNRAQLLYASSAAVYGASSAFEAAPKNELPLNVYGYSKLLFDQVIRRELRGSASQMAGFRYFNVYGPHEQHKGRMASVAFHHFHQLRDKGYVELFGDYGGYKGGEQRRDFVHVDDVVAVNLWFLQHPNVSGIFNLGTGAAEPFNAIAHAAVNEALEAAGQPAIDLAEQVQGGLIRYISFPEALVGKYQCHTEADITPLRDAGYDRPFLPVAGGVDSYCRWMRREGTGNAR